MINAKKTPSGKWRAQVVDGYEIVDGKRKVLRKSFTAATKQEAERMAAEYVANHGSCGPSEASVGIFGPSVDKYISVKENLISAATARGYRAILRNQLQPLYDRPMEDITNADIQALINDLSATMSPKSVRNVYGLITAVYNLYLPSRAISVTLPRKSTPPKQVPSDGDIQAMVAYFSEHDPIMLRAVYLAAFGTLRRSEICALTAQDFDHQNNTVHVHSAMVAAEGGQYITKCPKTESSDRIVTLPPFVLASIPTSGRIVPLTPSALTNRFERGLASAGLPPYTFHSLRAYAASSMHAIGIPDQYIMLQGGWSQQSTLTTIYEKPMDHYHTTYMAQATAHYTSLSSQLSSDCPLDSLQTPSSAQINSANPAFTTTHVGSTNGVSGIRTDRLVKLASEMARLEAEYGVKLMIVNDN